MDDQRALFKQVFGDSSDSEDYEQQQQQPQLEDRSQPTRSGQNPNWEQIKEVNGLWLCRDFLSAQEQSSLLSAIENEGWFIEASHNQAMRFGDLPPWASEISNSIRELVLLSDPAFDPLHLGTDCGAKEACPFPSHLLWREPLFDQLIVNAYQPGEGICAHVDLLRFEDGIAIVSLESSCVMHFTQVEEAYCGIANEGIADPPITKIPVNLTPGSLVLMSEEARYCWKHEINRKPGFQIWEGQELNQRRRISVTLRKLCKVE
ncbi:hypothetical protein FH972_005945 [Carpinus fangiana]|uniref:Fe2OG dioxygenase domain-containing protein n=1 Tax=Carpinus fangiana TaxID=176857 RepID=A0A5N6QTQ5_9ROSI|nr:hypothetical protein FH972_005945 [Carpinus fangiana]